MSKHSGLELEVAQLIIDTLNIEDLEPIEIDPKQPLFREGLGLDSIDALELSLAISKQYGFQIRSDDSENNQIFATLRSMSEHIEKNKS